MSIHDGHRSRLDEKVKKFGLEMLEEHEQLEHLLYAVIPRGDTNDIAHELLERFGTISAVLNASETELEKVEGVGPRTAKFIKDLIPLLGIVERSAKYRIPPRLDTAEKIADFVKTYFYGRLTEEVYMFSLNTSYRLVAVNKLRSGIAGEVYVFPSEIAKLALLDNATAIIVAHNHPGGSINPSRLDITLTDKIRKACKAIEVELLDSMVVSGEEYFSIMNHGYMEDVDREY
ncbi:MAG: DNA repair protein RadC [Clostridia bacterium]|nr:DNA repair protein RadC [Clostridia bacterium]